jgi:hypothetical protein
LPATAATAAAGARLDGGQAAQPHGQRALGDIADHGQGCGAAPMVLSTLVAPMFPPVPADVAQAKARATRKPTGMAPTR